MRVPAYSAKPYNLQKIAKIKYTMKMLAEHGQMMH